jgi:hypothetical protein
MTLQALVRQGWRTETVISAGVAMQAGKDARSRYGSCRSTLHMRYPVDRRARSALALQEVARVGLSVGLKAQTLRQSHHDIRVHSPVEVIVQLIRSSGQSASRTVVGYQVGKGTARHTREHRGAALWSKRPSWPLILSYSGNSFVISSAYGVVQRRAPEARSRRACSGSTARGRGNDDQQCDA